MPPTRRGRAQDYRRDDGRVDADQTGRTRASGSASPRRAACSSSNPAAARRKDQCHSRGVMGRGYDVPVREVRMYTRVLALTTSALILTFGTGGAIAQDRVMPQQDQQQTQSRPMSE